MGGPPFFTAHLLEAEDGDVAVRARLGKRGVRKSPWLCSPVFRTGSGRRAELAMRTGALTIDLLWRGSKRLQNVLDEGERHFSFA